jgi:Flp pilus assembly protein TadD
MRKWLSTALLTALAWGVLSACTGGGAGTGPTPAVSSSADVKTLLNLGIQQAGAGQNDTARATFQQVLALDPQNKYAWFNLGYLAQQANAPTEAVTDYDKALATDPNYTPAMYNKAIVLEATDVPGAIALYRKILTINPKASTTHVRLGILLDRTGDKSGAQAEFSSAVALDPQLLSAVPAAYRDLAKGQ